MAIRLTESPKVTVLTTERNKIWVIRDDYEKDFPIPYIIGHWIHHNTIILLSLMLATSGIGFFQKTKRLSLAWILLFFSHVVFLLVEIKCLYAMQFGKWSRIHYSNFQVYFYYWWKKFIGVVGSQSFPFVIWAGLNFRDILGNSYGSTA